MASTTRTRTTKKAAAPRDLPTDLKDTVNRAWAVGLGALNQASARGKEMFDELTEAQPELSALGKKGLASAKEGMDSARRRLEAMVDDKVAAALDRFGVPSKDEIRNLSRRVADLTAKVEKLSPKPAARPRR